MVMFFHEIAGSNFLFYIYIYFFVSHILAYSLYLLIFTVKSLSIEKTNISFGIRIMLMLIWGLWIPLIALE